MQHLTISPSTTLSDLSDVVGSRNIDTVLAANQLVRSSDVGNQHQQKVQQLVASADSISVSRKLNLLNSVTADSDVFEAVSLLSDKGWSVFDKLGSFIDTLAIPESCKIPDSSKVIGNGKPISKPVYDRVINDLSELGYVDPSAFSSPSVIPPGSGVGSGSGSGSSSRGQGSYGTVPGEALFESFAIPWGTITLYSSVTNDSVDFPVYPEELDDERSATYTQMPDLLYQYEPWQLYQNSGPRQHNYTFNMHRDMWTGDHRDGQANRLIRFCQAQCYPEFNGSAVNVPLVTLYVNGDVLIHGVMTSAKTHWDGPIGLDHWYLHFTLDITIVEVSLEVLNHTSVLNKSLIG